MGQDFSRWGRLASSDRAGAADGCSRYGGRDGSWTGFYVGGHVGYSRGNARVNLVDDDPTNFKSSFGSLFGGLQGGYNYVLPSRFLLGIEADASFPNYLSADDVVWSRTTPNTDIAEKID